MMVELNGIADQIEADGIIIVPRDRAAVTARGLAGLAGFLQEQILPEAANAGNEPGMRQLRWVIDTSMRFMARLTAYAETMPPDSPPLTLTLPPPPG